MKRLIFVLIFVSSLLTFTLANADTVTMRWVFGYYTSPGGEFTVQINNNNLSPDLNWVHSFYHQNTKDIGIFDPSFQTFCLEFREYISIGGTYNFSISDRAYLGGVGPDGDPISVGTAWLYTQFATGTLANYNYVPGIDRSTSAGYLQEIIWYLEGEIGSYSGLNPFVPMLNTQFGTLTNAMKDNSGQYPVAVLNLYTLGGALAQDQLVMVPEPSTLLLLGTGLIALGLAARRRRKQS